MNAPNNIFFSIITICYNIHTEISQTLDSILDQEFKGYELIIIDGKSTDGTLELIGKYKDENNVKIISEKDNGIYDAMNKGLYLSTGKYVIFMNGGDYFADSVVLSNINKQINIESPDFIYGDAFIKTTNDKLFYKKARSYTYFWYGMFTNHQSMIYKLDIVKSKSISFDTSYKIAADYKFTLEFIKNSKSFLYINKALSIFSLGGVSDTQKELGLNEAERARAEVLNYSFLKNKSIRFLLKTSQFCYKFMKPLYNKLRYNESISSSRTS